MFDLGRLEAPTVGSLMDCILDDFMYMADSEHWALAQDSRVVYIIYIYIYIYIYTYIYIDIIIYTTITSIIVCHHWLIIVFLLHLNLSTGTLNDQPSGGEVAVATGRLK